MVSLLRRAAPRRPLFTAGGVDRYQGESDCRKQALGGDAVSGVGYGCRLTALVRGWRSAWAAAAGGGAGAAGLPFGVVGLGSEACNGPDGGWELGGLRSAQTGGFGALPSPSLPDTFLAHTYDLPEQSSQVLNGEGCAHPLSHDENLRLKKSRGSRRLLASSKNALSWLPSLHTILKRAHLKTFHQSSQTITSCHRWPANGKT